MTQKSSNEQKQEDQIFCEFKELSQAKSDPEQHK